jgi:hypothetical protein
MQHQMMQQRSWFAPTWQQTLTLPIAPPPFMRREAPPPPVVSVCTLLLLHRQLEIENRNLTNWRAALCMAPSPPTGLRDNDHYGSYFPTSREHGGRPTTTPVLLPQPPMTKPVLEITPKHHKQKHRSDLMNGPVKWKPKSVRKPRKVKRHLAEAPTTMLPTKGSRITSTTATPWTPSKSQKQLPQAQHVTNTATTTIDSSSSRPVLVMPLQEEIDACATKRFLRSLYRWYGHFNDLVAFREEHGHCVVPKNSPLYAGLDKVRICIMCECMTGICDFTESRTQVSRNVSCFSPLTLCILWKLPVDAKPAHSETRHGRGCPQTGRG